MYLGDVTVGSSEFESQPRPESGSVFEGPALGSNRLYYA
jgi:hypothetical protein